MKLNTIKKLDRGHDFYMNPFKNNPTRPKQEYPITYNHPTIKSLTRPLTYSFIQAHNPLTYSITYSLTYSFAHH